MIIIETDKRQVSGELDRFVAQVQDIMLDTYESILHLTKDTRVACTLVAFTPIEKNCAEPSIINT